MLEAITPYAPIISAGSALISAIAVLISTWFVIWTTYFRKTKRDRIDDLKEEMLILFSEGLYCLRFFRPLPKTRLCYNTILLKGVI